MVSGRDPSPERSQQASPMTNAPITQQGLKAKRLLCWLAIFNKMQLSKNKIK